jgi:hypothetical protein
MDNIIEPNETFDFSKISLANPISIQGNAYFTKILNNNKPFYIQSPKSLTRQGFIKNGKKIYCDLMFNNNDEVFIHWIENLEERCQKLIFEKSEDWFQGSLDLNDIEGAFNSLIKVYKSGKNYLIKTNVKVNTLTGAPLIKIYNESETVLSLEDINSETNIISLIEILGIKFTSRNFQIELELKQVMVLNTDYIFESCLIKKKQNILESSNTNTNTNNIIVETNKKNNGLGEVSFEINDKNENNNISENNLINNISENISLDNSEKDNDTQISDILENIENEKKELIKKEDNNDDNNADKENLDINLDIEDLNLISELEESKELKEYDLTEKITNDLETIQLKKPNQVYYEIYREAKNKAKIAKQAAIMAYLEAKNIKKTYLLEDIDSSDDENSLENDLYNSSDEEIEIEEET